MPHEEYRMPRSTDALELLRRDHEEVQKLFRRAHRAQGDEKEQLAREIVERLQAHTRLEEEIFYPFLREATGRDDLIEEADIEHEAAQHILDELEGRPLDSPRFDALLKVLAEYVAHHVKEEEEVIFPLARKTGVDLDALGAELMERRDNGGPSRGPDGGQRSKGRQHGDGRRDARRAAQGPPHDDGTEEG